MYEGSLKVDIYSPRLMEGHQNIIVGRVSADMAVLSVKEGKRVELVVANKENTSGRRWSS